MDFGGGAAPSALHTLARVAVALADAEQGRGAPVYQYLLRAGEELPWGTGEGIPAAGVLEFWAEILPGTSREELEAELRETVEAAAAGGVPLRWEQRTRFLSPLDQDPETAIVAAMRRALRRDASAPQIAPFACDGFVFAEYSPTPVVICGPGGDNPHAPDEYVLIEHLHSLVAAYVRLALDWCGVA
jgi:acetylornithine deacetylase